MPIKILAPDVVSKIAAGEVVERPASVVKELTENSLDAGATRINIEARNGGVDLIRVSDNGVGMSPGEVEIAFQRHATSKITSLIDLESVVSLGFRGEALPSISAVAQVELLTRTVQETAGTYLRLHDGQVTERGVKGCSSGTAISVQNLFRNVPARLKFLKAPSTENSHMVNLVNHLALAFPEVQFILIIDGRETLHTSGNGKLRDVLAELYGAEIAKHMLQIGEGESEHVLPSPTSPLIVSGYVAPSSITRNNRSYLNFYVNRRWVTSRLLTAAVEKAYEGWLMVGRHPISVINISLAPREIDANVHPSKREVKFLQDQVVFSAVHKVIQTALEDQTPVPKVIPYSVPTPPHPPHLASLHSPSHTSMPLFPPVSLHSPTPTSMHPLPPSTLPLLQSSLPVLRVVGQFADSYIIAEGPDGLYLIDQHAAHERILFDKFSAQHTEEQIDVQGLLDPLTIELSARQRQLFDSKKDTLTRFGFRIESFGEKAILLRGMPALLKLEAAAQVVTEILDSSDEGSPLAERERGIAISVACHSAVKAGQILSIKELQELVRGLEQTISPRTCPHGRPTMVHLSSGQLAREFGRR